MDPAVQNLILACAGAVIFLLLAVVGWLVRDRLRKAEKKEETLEKRLSSGSETMQRIMQNLERLQASQTENAARLLSLTQFEEYRRDHAEDHRKLEDRMDRVCIGQDEMRTNLEKLGERLEGRLTALGNLLAAKVEITE